MAPILGYWDIRGLAEPIRLLLKYVGEVFEDKRYPVVTLKKHEMDLSGWLKDKFSLGLPFPNLPYYLDGDVKLTQSLAIMRYLGRKYNLVGETESQRQLVDVLEQQAHDLRMALITTAYSPDFDKKKGDFIKGIPDRLKPFDAVLTGKKWLMGGKITYVDFLLYEALDHLRILDPRCLDQFHTLTEYMDNFESLPNIKKYMKSADFKPWPLYGSVLYWGYYK